MNNEVSKSWFCVFANPEEHGYVGSPEEICNRLKDEWIENNDTRTGAWLYCVSAEGLHHIHMVLEDNIAMRFSKIKKTYAIGAHIEATKGNKSQVEAYIQKLPPYEEKGELVVCVVRHGEIKGVQGKRSDLSTISEMIEAGCTPDEILAVSFRYYRYEKMIRAAYIDKRRRETAVYREVKVHYLIGGTGSGKTKSYVDLTESLGEGHVYLMSDYTAGGFDRYAGEEVLIIDEYRGQWPFQKLLQILDRYKVQVHARFSNVFALWTEVYITSPLPPETIYELMVPANQREMDSYQQLVRRINDISYCFRNNHGDFQRYTIPMTEYSSFEELKYGALEKATSLLDGMIESESLLEEDDGD